MATDHNFKVKNGLVVEGGEIYLQGVATPQIFFNGSSDTGIDMAIKATPESLDFYEPEDSNKLHMRIIDDAGVNAVFGVRTGAGDGTLRLDGSGNLQNIGTISSGNITSSGDVTISGNLTVNGTQTTLNTATLQVEDKNIVLNYGTGSTVSTAHGSGITIQDAMAENHDATILWSTSEDRFNFSDPVNIALTGANQQPGADSLTVAGYGIIGNRGAVYLTNANSSGTVQIGVGGTHNANPKLTVSSTAATFTVPVTSTYFLSSLADSTPAGTTFSNVFKGNNQRTVYFDSGDGSAISTWYGSGNTPFAAIDANNGILRLYVNNTSGNWNERIQMNSSGITHYGATTVNATNVHLNSSSSAYYRADGANNQWKYLSLQTGGSTNWDIATKNDDLSGALQFRPSGGPTNRTYMDTSGNWVFNGRLTNTDTAEGQKVVLNFDTGGDMILGHDGSYGNSGNGRYITLGFGGTTNGTNRIFAHNGTSDGMYFAAATGRGFYWRTNGSGSNSMVLESNGQLTVSSGNVKVRADSSYGSSYGTVGFGGTSTGFNRISGRNSADDGLFLHSATGRHIYFRTGGSTSNTFTMTSGGQFQVGSTTVIDSSRNLTNIGTITNSGKISSSIGSNATYSGPLLEITTSATPTQIKITTNILYSGTGASTHAHSVTIRGFQYGSAQMADLQIGWHVYNNEFYNRSVTSSGSWAPTVTLAVENNKVVIHLASPGYWPKLYVESMYNAYGGAGQASGWSWADAAISADSGTPNQTVPYKFDYGNGVLNSGGTTVITSSRELQNLHGHVRSDSNFSFLTMGGNAQNIRTKSVFAGTSYGDTPPAGSFNATNTYELNGTTVIDSSRNLTNIGTITATGQMTLPDAGYSIGNELHVWKRDYSVSISSPQDILYRDGNALPNGGAYRVQAHISGTGTDQSATAVFWNQNGTWKVNATYQSGTSSNHPEFKVGSNGKPQIQIDHASNYTISILHERLELGESTGTDNKSGFGADGYLSEVLGVLRHNPYGGSDHTAGNRIFADNYHPNANKWTTGRTHTVTLTGQVTGTASQTVDGSANETWTINTTLNDSALDDQYVTVGSRYTGDGSGLIQPSKASIRIWDVSTASDDPSGAVDGLVLSAGWDSSSWGIQQYHDFHTNDLYLRSKQNGTMSSWDKVFHDTYHPNADKWTTARSHTVTLTGEVTGTATQSVDGTGNKTWSIATTLNNDSLNDQYVQQLPDLTSGAPTYQTPSSRRVDPNAGNPTNHHYAIMTYGNGGNVTGQLATHFQDGSTYNRAYNNSWSAWSRMFDDDYHPNADKWTTARSHTVTLTGEVTGTATQSVDGTGNKTWSIATTLNNTALDDQYVDVTGDTMTGNLTIGTTTDSTKLVFPDKNVLENPTAAGNKRQLIGMGNSGAGGMWQTTGRGGLMLASADDSLILASGDVARGYDPDAGAWNPNPDDEDIYLLTDGSIRFRTNLQTASAYKQMSFDANGDLTVSRNITAGGTITSTGNITSSGSITASGTITSTSNMQHTGLTMTSGTDIDQLYTVTDSLTLTTSYQDTSINGSELATGTYIMQLYVAGDHSVGGSHYNEFYSGVISWYGSTTNSTEVDEIVLHRAGHAPNTSVIHLRTQRHASGGDNLVLQIKGNYNMTAARNYVFKFRRMI